GLADAYAAAAREARAPLALVGLARAHARRELPRVELFDPDGVHPSPAGSYLAAATFYATLYDAAPGAGADTVRGHPAADDRTDSSRTVVLAARPPATARALRDIALRAVREWRASPACAARCARTSASAPTEWVTADDGARLHVRILGAGRDTVLVPLASHLADDLAPLARGRVLVAYDPRSRGRSEPVRDTARLGLTRDVADLEAVRRALGVSRPSVIGWSYFAGVAAAWADAHPDRVARLVLLAPIVPRAARPEAYPTPPDAPARPAHDTALARRFAKSDRSHVVL
ncbi:alpha/beta fold hydrolase, partial [Roseisolibacter sp. H3M3-2]|uniref:alpha/beta fold hydrolase n=1 Tax=Roseisolibacter sp. H3M3-2 TaxID=3031323 RepID=UPI0023DA76AA